MPTKRRSWHWDGKFKKSPGLQSRAEETVVTGPPATAVIAERLLSTDFVATCFEVHECGKDYMVKRQAERSDAKNGSNPSNHSKRVARLFKFCRARFLGRMLGGITYHWR